MAIKREDLPPGTDLLMREAEGTASDRAKRINSLHRQVDKIVTAENRKRMQVSRESDSLLRQKEALRRELDYARTELSSEMAQDYNKVVKGLGSTIQQLSIGVKNITLHTARATTDVISQYGKAISQDISINKTNTVAMALAKATPLFGYFAAKFMETDVFQGAARKIREKLGSAILSGLSAVGRKVFGRETPQEKIAKRERELGALTGEITALKKELATGKTPSLQVGGVVKKGGVVQVHAAEVITPIDKFVKNIRGIDPVKQEKWQDRVLKALIDLKVIQVGTTNRLRLGLQRMMLENPAMRAILGFSEVMKGAVVAPIKWLFGARGGYLSDVKRATATSNVYLKSANLLGLIYTTGMPKLDAIAKYTRITATAVSGEEPSEPMPTRYSMFQKIKASIKKGKFELGERPGETFFEGLAERLGLHKESLAEAGVTGFADLSPAKLFSQMKESEEGFAAKKKAAEFWKIGKEKLAEATPTKEVLMEKAKVAKQQAEEIGKQVWEQSKKYKDSGMEKLNRNIQDLKNLKKKQEDREGPHSPSMVQRIAEIAETGKKQYKSAKERGKEQLKELTKSRKVQELTESKLGQMGKKAGKFGSTLWKIGMFLFTMFQKVLTAGFSMLGNLLSPLLSALGIRGLFMKGGPGFIAHGKMAAGALGKKGAQAGTFAGKTARVAGMAGPGAAAKFAGKGVGRAAWGGVKGAGKIGGAALKTGGRILGAGAGLITGVGFGLWDAISAMRDPEGFAGGVIARGFAGFLGGTDTGVSGAISGAMKLGGIGAAVGSIIPGIGTLIGGAIGAGAGAILGFIGGKRISKAIAGITYPLKKIVKTWWRVITFPWKLMREGAKFVWKFFTETKTGKVLRNFLFPIIGIFTLITKVAKGISRTTKFIYRMAKKWWGKNKDTWVGKGLKFIWNRITFPFRMVGWIIDLLGKIPEGFRKMQAWLAEKISKIPFVGRFLKGVKEFVKSVEEGTAAEKGIEFIKKAEAGTPIEIGKEPISTTAIGKAAAVSEAQRRKFEAEQRAAATKEMTGKMDEMGKMGVASNVVSSTNVVNSINNIASTNNMGGGAARRAFGSSGRYTSAVEQCNIS